MGTDIFSRRRSNRAGPRVSASIARRIKLSAGLAIGTAIMLVILMVLAVSTLLSATSRIVHEIEDEALLFLDLHSGMLATIPFVAEELELNIVGSPDAIVSAKLAGRVTLFADMDEKITWLQTRDHSHEGQTDAFALGVARWEQAKAMIPPLIASGVSATDISALPFYASVVEAAAAFRQAHELSMLSVQENQNRVWTLVQTIRTLAVAIALTLVVGTILWTRRHLRSVLRPLRELEAAAMSVTRGDLKHVIPGGGPSELATLADAFNAMVVAVQERETQLTFRALHDPLTGLGNRALLEVRMRGALSRLRRSTGMSFALFFIDLDRFKKVNDTLGHGVGDEAIRVAGQRIQTCLREGDTLVRLGGDEFAVLVEDLSGDIPALGGRIRDALRKAFVVGGAEVRLTASIGVVEATSGHESIEDLLRFADLAMYRAKERSGDQLSAFDHSLSTEAARRFEVEGALRHGIAHGELVVYYQPVVELSTGVVNGVEALVRWVHPERGLLLPAEFIPIAEETGLIVTLGNEVLRIATQDLAGWIERGEVGSEFSLAVNVSARQVARSDFADCVRDQLAASGLPASRLILEITETALLDDSEALRIRLASLRAGGVRVALDDFGVGYSSLQRLSSLPVDVVKIDRSFVLGIAHRDDLVSLVRAMLELASSFGYEAVAEGIEEIEDSEALQVLGCHLGQGFGLFRPAPAEAIRALLATHASSAALIAQ